MQPYVSWALLFASVTYLQGYIRWDLFVLGAQPLDTSPLSLYWHNKTLFPAKLPQCSVSQLEIPTTVEQIWRRQLLPQIQREWQQKEIGGKEPEGYLRWGSWERVDSATGFFWEDVLPQWVQEEKKVKLLLCVCVCVSLTIFSQILAPWP
jgi:hypothetical protein